MLLLTTACVCSEWNVLREAHNRDCTKCSVLLLRCFVGFVASPLLNMGRSSVEDAKTLCLIAALLLSLLLSVWMFLSVQKNTCQGFSSFCFRTNLFLPFFCHLGLVYDIALISEAVGCVVVLSGWRLLFSECWAFLVYCGDRKMQSTQRCPQICSKMELKRRKYIKLRAATSEQSTCFKQVTNPTGVKCSAGSELQKVSQLNLSCGGTWAKGGRAFKQRLLGEGK